jgi:hypothetical protein
MSVVPESTTNPFPRFHSPAGASTVTSSPWAPTRLTLKVSTA